MFCPSCGTKNDDDAKFCQSCGTNLRLYQNQTPADRPNDYMTGQSNQPSYNGYNDQPYRQSQSSSQSRYTSNISSGVSQVHQEEVSGVLYVCSLCVPFVGLVLTVAYWNINKSAAQTMLILSILNMVLFVFINVGRF